jgi:flagellar biosynthesis anti-sigma factor FlgM
MSTVDSVNRSPFFPNSKDGKVENAKKNLQTQMLEQRNDNTKAKLLKKKTQDDAKVSISNPVKDFARIKKAVDNSPEIDNSQKIAALKNKINTGAYSFDYDAMADRILSEQF